MSKQLESRTSDSSPPAMPPWPYFGEEEIAAVHEVLASGKVNYWTGTEGRTFEEEYARFVGVGHAVALANGTVALELALESLGIGHGAEVVGTPRTFIASASAVVMRGATPVMADVDRDSQNVTADTIAAVLTRNTKAVICVHLAGWPCDMSPILELARDHELVVIEDCAQAHGAKYRGRQVGSFGDAGAFSFCQDKILTTGGEGGMLTTDDETVWKRAWSFKDHGKGYDVVHHHKHPPGFRWLHEQFGTNWRMTEMQAAIGRVILRKLPDWVTRRRQNASILQQYLAACPAVRLTIPPDDVYHAYYKFYTFVRPENLKPGWDRDRIMNEINAVGVPCYSGSCSEIYLEEAFTPSIRPPQRLPIARELGETGLMFLVHPTLTEEFLHHVGKIAQRVLTESARKTTPNARNDK